MHLLQVFAQQSSLSEQKKTNTKPEGPQQSDKQPSFRRVRALCGVRRDFYHAVVRWLKKISKNHREEKQVFDGSQLIGPPFPPIDYINPIQCMSHINRLNRFTHQR